MDVKQLRSEDQMDLMMMMEMSKHLPVFSQAYNSVAELPPPEQFSGASSSNKVGAMPQYIDIEPHMASPSFVNLTSSIVSFTNTNPIHQESSAPISFLSSTSIGKWGGILSDAGSFAAPSQKRNSMAAMREMIFRIAAMQPIHIDPESVKPPKRRNVKISKDPQSVAARHRRERISERIRILQRLVPGGTKMDTASMLDEAIHYVKFLKTQVQSLERAAANRPTGQIGFPVAMSSGSYLPMAKAFQAPPQNVQPFEDAN
ncbi:transcription factor HEC2-like [Carya illinoinensis]|uniref:BHLH domain-containing protein n=1 Tax=Carya illinoinensis TaxID=32201 RepID=A0A8T1NAG5_CARIL|nr:transcription factor HEC2-like [Carya illinoinensis]KAG6626528.1 hypothetical protein CIPAW_15G055200 [Carya illinoinensis]